jgi:hypothetical protein
LSYLPLKSYWRIPIFFFYTAQVMKQLASADGVLGYSVLARPLSKQFWTLSSWKDEVALLAFVQHPPHVRIMTALAPHMGETKFVRWTVKGSELPLSWEGAPKIHLAEWKIFKRLQTISADSDHHKERSAIADALNALRFLKRDTLNYPDWNPP